MMTIAMSNNFQTPGFFYINLSGQYYPSAVQYQWRVFLPPDILSFEKDYYGRGAFGFFLAWFH